MSKPSDGVLEKVKAREVTGVLRSREALDQAVQALLLAGFDRADIDLMASVDAVRDKLRAVYIPAHDLADHPHAPRRAYLAHEDVSIPLSLTSAILTYVGATAGALGVVASGGTLALALAAAAAGGAVTGGIGALIARHVGQQEADELVRQLARGGLVLWVRVRSSDREEQAQQILRDYGAEAVHVHEVEIEKRLDDIPLSSIRPDPWLGSEPLGHV